MAAIRFYRPERGWSPSGSAAGSAANAVVHSGLMEIRHRDNTPSVDPGAYIAPTAVLSGQVRVGPGSCVLHGAVLSADGGPVDVGTSCVIMEHAVLRGTSQYPLTVGDHVLAGPHCYLTGCAVGDEVFIATGAMVFNGAQMGFLSRSHNGDEPIR